MNNLGDYFSMVSRLQKKFNPVFTFKTGPMCTLSHKAHTSFESGLLRGSVCSLQNSVHILSLLLGCLVTKYWLCQLLMRNLHLVTREQWCCCVRCLAFALPKPVRSLRCVKFVRSASESSGTAR